MAISSWVNKIAQIIGLNGSDSARKPDSGAVSDRGILVFANTSEVIAAERVLRRAGFDVEVKGPPPDLQTGCDMVVVFPVLRQAAVENTLREAGMAPEKVITAEDSLLDPVSLYHTKALGDYLMVRAANMKITIDTKDDRIVNVSGGGCSDVPWLAQQLVGKKICDAPEPISMGHTLCCYSLQKAYEELKRLRQCG